MRSFLAQLSHKIDLPSSRNLVGILLEGMADLADKMAANTCETEKLEESGSLKRAIQDDDQLTDEASNKKLKIAEPAEQVTEDGNTEKANIIPRRKKCALLLSYCGVGYNGMQMNPGVRTIEEELVNSLYKAEAITVDGKECMGKMSFQRCARTDKGVSAARQVMVPLESILPSINEHLPPEIRVMAMKRTTRGFDAKATCSGRTYEYLTPTYAFAKEYQTSASYRVTAEKIEEANKVLAKFLGTHNYHNFTSGKRFNDASAKRYIMKFKCGKPFEKDGREFIVMSVKGQSFMLHQIRKMIGLALAIVRGIAPISTIELAKQEKKVDIPKAPAVGLVLDQVHFESYNRRYGSDGIHETLEWEDYEEEIQQFKDKFIYKHITDTEAKDHVMLRWLKTLPDHTYTDERMEEIQAKPVRDARQSTKTENTSDQLNSTGGSSGSKHSMEGGMDDDVCNAGGTSDLKQSMKGGGNGDRKTSMEGGERDEVSIAGKTSDLKHPMEGRESGELCDAGGRGDLEQVIECGEIGNEEVKKEVEELEETPAALKVSNGGGSLTQSLEVKQEQANL